MRILASAALIILLTAGSALAQRGGMRGGGGFGRGFGGGGGHRGVVGGGFHRGGGFAGGFHGIPRGGFRSNIGIGRGFHGSFGFRSGFHRGFGFRSGFFGGHRSRGFFLPYSYVWPAYPSFPYGYGSSYVWDYSLGYPGYSSLAVPSAYAAQPAPPVVVTQQYASPVIRETSPLVRPYVPPEPEQPTAADRSAIYLIAFDDGVIRPALAYWVENGTLHYLGLDRKQHQTRLDAVDRDLSLQLNRERRVPFRLPEP